MKKSGMPWTLWRYLAARYGVQLLIVASGLLGLVYMFETIELMRRASGNEGLGILSILGMAALKLPETAQILFPFIILVAGLALFWQLGRASEIVVMRAAGLSVWQFMAPIISVAFAMGVLNIILLQPLGAASLTRYDVLESQYLGTPRRIAALNQQGLWLRDAQDGQVRLLHARHVDQNGSRLREIMILNVSEDGQLIGRIDAQRATFDDKIWALQAGLRTDENGNSAAFDTMALQTNLRREDVYARFNEASSFSSWDLPAHIKAMAASGFPTRNVLLYYHNLLATPFLWVAMALIATVVSLTPYRLARTALMLTVGVGCGFFYFLFARYFEALSLTQRIPVAMAAWVPVILAMLIPLSTLLRREE